jgi:hypothetical protein
MKKLLRKILLELEIPNPVYGASNSTTIRSRYGMRKHPVTGKNKMHYGIDIPVKCGTKLKSPDNGRITEAGFKEDGCGGRIRIDHGMYSTRYCHLKEIFVKTGDWVNQNDEIASTGGEKNTKGAGLSTGCHLHMEVKRNDQNIDPETVVDLSKNPKEFGDEKLKKGYRGSSIGTLQCFLKHSGVDSNLEKTNLLDDDTMRAIKKFQSEVGMIETGEVSNELIIEIRDYIKKLDKETKNNIKDCYSN